VRCHSAARLAALQPPSLLETAAALRHVTGFPGPGLLRRLRPTRPVQRSVRLSRPARWVPAGREPARMGPVFTVIRSAEEEPDCVPATSPRLRRRLSAWPPGPANEDLSGSSRRNGKQRDAPRPAQIRQVRAGVKVEGRNNAGSSRTPFRHARRTRPIWQYWTRPGFVRAAPALPGTTRLRLPSATVTCCDRPPAKVSHLHSNQQRLTAQAE
jgi:hypothetical protein